MRVAVEACGICHSDRHEAGTWRASYRATGAEIADHDASVRSAGGQGPRVGVAGTADMAVLGLLP